MLEKIASLQVQREDECYSKGMFPSQRRHFLLPIAREDDNIFFSASILFMLQQLEPLMDDGERVLLKQIRDGVHANYSRYESRDGVPLFNFYRNKPEPMPFPNGRFMHKTQKFILPDDIDVTALVMLSFGNECDLEWLQERLRNHANGVHLWNTTAPKEYRKIQAYSTWFGVKMPIEFDVCAQANLMLLFVGADPCVCPTAQEADTQVRPYDEFGQATMTLISKVIEQGDYFHRPFHISPSYPNTAIVLYHLARLFGTGNTLGHVPLKEKLAKDIQAFWPKANNKIEELLLSTAFFRLTGSWELLPSELPSSDDLRRFSWFSAAFLSVFGNPLINRMAANRFFHLEYVCEAFNLTLVYEFQKLGGRTAH